MEITKETVDAVLSEVEQEMSKAFESMSKNEEEIEETVETTEEVVEESLDKSEDREEDYETIEELYASMEKGEMEAHYNAMKEVMFGKSEEEMAKAKKRDHAEGDPAEKEWENKASQTEGYEDLSPHGKKQKAKEMQAKAAKEAGFGKSEDNVEVEMLKSENEELKKSYEELNTLVEQLMNSTKKAAPAGKAITSSNYIAKSEETEQEEVDLSSLSKNEISSKLKSLDYSKLEKSDRKAINEYYLENGSVDKIKHLITK